MIQLTEIAWLAGLFDGEGSARIYRSNQRGKGGGLSYFVQVQAVSNTDPTIIERVTKDLELMGLKGKYHKRRDNGNPKQKHAKIWWKACGDVRVTSYESCFTFLNAILPFLTGDKKAQAEHCLAFIRVRLSRGRRNWGKGKPVELQNQDKDFFDNQPRSRGIRVN